MDKFYDLNFWLSLCLLAAIAFNFIAAIRCTKLSNRLADRVYDLGNRINHLIYWRSLRDIERLEAIKDRTLKEEAELNDAKNNVKLVEDALAEHKKTRQN